MKRLTHLVIATVMLSPGFSTLADDDFRILADPSDSQEAPDEPKTPVISNCENGADFEEEISKGPKLCNNLEVQTTNSNKSFLFYVDVQIRSRALWQCEGGKRIDKSIIIETETDFTATPGVCRSTSTNATTQIKMETWPSHSSLEEQLVVLAWQAQRAFERNPSTSTIIRSSVITLSSIKMGTITVTLEDE